MGNKCVNVEVVVQEEKDKTPTSPGHQCPIEVSVMMECSVPVLSNTHG